jgi:hypothetical protein
MFHPETPDLCTYLLSAHASIFSAFTKLLYLTPTLSYLIAEIVLGVLLLKAAETVSQESYI